MTEIARKLRGLRPKLKEIAPLPAAIMRGYIAVNLILGAGLMSFTNPTGVPFPIVNNVLTFQVWGMVFIALGLFKLYSYLRNDFDLMKISLVIGLVVKSTWAVALIIRAFDGGGLLLLAIWLFFAYVQGMTYMHFIPTLTQKDKA